MTNPFRSIGDLFGKVVHGDVINYQAPKPVPGTQEFTATAPTMASVGGTPRMVPQEWHQPLSEAYKANPSLPRGLLEATLMHESSMGTIPRQYNQVNGESGWLGGMTDVARRDLLKNKIPTNLDTQAGVINAMASYLALKQKGTDNKGRTFNYTDPAKLYFERYKTDATTNKTTPDEIKRFKSYIAYYGGQPRNFDTLSQ